ncbi:uncharacterized protein IWZ02DRAFT_433283 [Phyllosticta citriasiana]|uniref:uncharacterized protein n=1 Tax=Phyllosticta citriasiana TaxID=595635 RepID=UPI0030FD3E64
MSRHNDVGLEVLNLADAGNPSLTQLARTDLAELLVYVAKDSVAADGEPQRRYLQHRAVVRVGLSDSNDTHLVPVDAEDAAGGQRLRLCRRLIDLPREIDVPNARNRHVVVLLHVRDGAGIGDGLRARQAALQRRDAEPVVSVAMGDGDVAKATRAPCTCCRRATRTRPTRRTLATWSRRRCPTGRRQSAAARPRARPQHGHDRQSAGVVHESLPHVAEPWVGRGRAFAGFGGAFSYVYGAMSSCFPLSPQSST